MTTDTQINAMGRMALLLEDIKTTARERDNLIRPLRERFNRALPTDRFPPEVPNMLDLQAAKEEFLAVQRVETTLSEMINDYNYLAASIERPLLKRADR